MSWAFAKVNGRLAEVFFDQAKNGPTIWGHCYVERSEYSKREQQMVDADIKKHHFTYRNKMYYDQIRKHWLKSEKPSWLKKYQNKRK